MAPQPVLTKTYPYNIPPSFCPPPDVLKKADPWYVLEFLRIEALLRSDDVCQLYKDTFAQWNDENQFSDTMFIEHGVFWGWHILDAAHHAYLVPAAMEELDRLSGRLHDDAGISDLQAFFRNRIKMGFPFKEDAVMVCERMVNDDPRYIWIRIDAAQAPHSVLAALEEKLKRLHKTVEIPVRQATIGILKESRFVEVPHHPRKPPPIRDLPSWLKYFMCYDLRTINGLTYGQIAQRVYQTKGKNASDQVRKAVARVDQLISYATSGPWPPPPIK